MVGNDLNVLRLQKYFWNITYLVAAGANAGWSWCQQENDRTADLKNKREEQKRHISMILLKSTIWNVHIVQNGFVVETAHNAEYKQARKVHKISLHVHDGTLS